MITVTELGADTYAIVAAVLHEATGREVTAEALRQDDARAGPLAPKRWLATGTDGTTTLATLRPQPDGRGVVDFLHTASLDPAVISASLPFVEEAARTLALRRLASTASHTGERAPFDAAGYRPAREVAVLSLDPAQVGDDVRARFARAAAWARRHRVNIRSMAELAGDPRRDRRVCELDTALRQHVAGTEGWTWSFDAFLDETYTPGFDPDRYLIALNATGNYVGLLRIWMNASGPKLGLIGVLEPSRHRGFAAALIHRAVVAWPALETRPIRATVDRGNPVTWKLAATLGFEVVRTVTEMEKPLR